ncbi:MAG: DivIVA domain-containing protein [Longimicrobiales bacterium]
MIDLTPLDVRKKKGDFRRGLRGYEVPQVDDFLDLVAERLEAVVRANLEMTERLKRLEQQLAEFKDREKALTDALVTAQTMREQIRSQSTREGDLLRRRAEEDAALIRTEAEQMRGREEDSLRGLRERQVRFLADYRSFLEQELSQMSVHARTIEEKLSTRAASDRPEPAPAPSPSALAFAPQAEHPAPPSEDLVQGRVDDRNRHPASRSGSGPTFLPVPEPAPVEAEPVAEDDKLEARLGSLLSEWEPENEEIVLDEQDEDVADFLLSDAEVTEEPDSFESLVEEETALEPRSHAHDTVSRHWQAETPDADLLLSDDDVIAAAGIGSTGGNDPLFDEDEEAALCAAMGFGTNPAPPVDAFELSESDILDEEPETIHAEETVVDRAIGPFESSADEPQREPEEFVESNPFADFDPFAEEEPAFTIGPAPAARPPVNHNVIVEQAEADAEFLDDLNDEIQEIPRPAKPARPVEAFDPFDDDPADYLAGIGTASDVSGQRVDAQGEPPVAAANPDTRPEASDVSAAFDDEPEMLHDLGRAGFSNATQHNGQTEEPVDFLAGFGLTLRPMFGPKDSLNTGNDEQESPDQATRDFYSVPRVTK